MEGYRMQDGSSDDSHRKGYHEHLDDIHPESALKKMRTAGSISISPELFEKMYLSPQNKVPGDLRKKFANPTPIAICGFVMSLGPLSCDLMGWRGAGGNGAASIPVYLFFGGILMIIGGLLEFILGNTFPSVVFTAFGATWLSYGGTFLPQLNAYAAYAPPTASSPAEGLQTQGFNASIGKCLGFWTLSMALLCFVFLICSLRTNIVFVVTFFALIFHFGFATGAFWALGADYAGNAHFASRLLVGAGASAFVATAAGWWILFTILLASVDFPFALPVGDLSTAIRGASERGRSQV
ncbi:Uu.00g020630.m01.CDS01 [Anthostomella pinea]|uniref:Uu.00g020630.m01.CDS01 n=1 Tax=Anthostomella pinea TaxID=933095 RepID=A0AAI8VZH8_9PEZI|nr:Uu.00g020630.m01.CDS01 [Anthostomella pinea]